MAGIAAGVVAAGDVNSQPGTAGGSKFDLSSPATWTLIWFVLATLYLMAVYFGMFRIHR